VNKLRIFVDADVLFAGSASPSEHGASLILLRLGELTLIDAVASEQVILEVERNLMRYLPSQMATFRFLVSRCLRIVADPIEDELHQYRGLADAKDLPILASAVREQCQWLATFNVRDYIPGHSSLKIEKPGALVQEIRSRLAG
jgi:hypothetical protein